MANKIRRTRVAAIDGIDSTLQMFGTSLENTLSRYLVNVP